MKNRARGSWLVLVLTLACTFALAADAPKQEEQGYVIVPAATWATVVELIERQQLAIEVLRKRLRRKNICKEV